MLKLAKAVRDCFSLHACQDLEAQLSEKDFSMNVYKRPGPQFEDLGLSKSEKLL